MPFMPNVPYFVGDDEDGEESTQTSYITAPSMEHGREMPESEFSDISRSSVYDDISESDEDDSNNSTAAGADWSNNIAYIVRTPARELEQLTQWASTKYNALPKIEYDVSPTEYPGIGLTDEQSAEDEQLIDSTQDLINEEVEKQEDLSMEACEKNERNAEPESSAESSLSYSPVGPDRIINEESQSSSDSTQVDNEKYEDMQKSNPSAKKSIINTPFKLSRRLSLRSAYRSESTKSVTPPKKSVSRVVKRTRRSTPRNAALILKKKALKLAQPTEVTEYFTKISATLVRNRVNLMPFLYIRNRIDHLVGEAIAKTKIQVENGPKSPF